MGERNPFEDVEGRRVDFREWLPPLPPKLLPQRLIRTGSALSGSFFSTNGSISKKTIGRQCLAHKYKPYMKEVYKQAMLAKRNNRTLLNSEVLPEILKSLVLEAKVASFWAEEPWDIIRYQFELHCVISDPCLHLRGDTFALDVRPVRDIRTADYVQPATTMDERAALFPGDYGCEKFALGGNPSSLKEAIWVLAL